MSPEEVAEMYFQFSDNSALSAKLAWRGTYYERALDDLDGAWAWIVDAWAIARYGVSMPRDVASSSFLRDAESELKSAYYSARGATSKISRHVHGFADVGEALEACHMNDAVTAIQAFKDAVKHAVGGFHGAYLPIPENLSNTGFIGRGLIEPVIGSRKPRK